MSSMNKVDISKSCLHNTQSGCYIDVKGWSFIVIDKKRDFFWFHELLISIYKRLTSLIHIYSCLSCWPRFKCSISRSLCCHVFTEYSGQIDCFARKY